MAGKPRDDRESVATVHFAMRLRPSEAEQLSALVDDENARLASEGRPESMTKNAMVRFLIERAFVELQRRKKPSLKRHEVEDPMTTGKGTRRRNVRLRKENEQ